MCRFHEGEGNQPDGQGTITGRGREVAQLDVREAVGGARQRAAALTSARLVEGGG
jgi:hypothetical protein